MAEGEALVRRMLELIGEDPSRDGLRDTPARVVRSWGELFGGYGEDPARHLERTFPTTSRPWWPTTVDRGQPGIDS